MFSRHFFKTLQCVVNKCNIGLGKNWTNTSCWKVAAYAYTQTERMQAADAITWWNSHFYVSTRKTLYAGSYLLTHSIIHSKFVSGSLCYFICNFIHSSPQIKTTFYTQNNNWQLEDGRKAPTDQLRLTTKQTCVAHHLSFCYFLKDKRITAFSPCMMTKSQDIFNICITYVVCEVKGKGLIYSKT